MASLPQMQKVDPVVSQGAWKCSKHTRSASPQGQDPPLILATQIRCLRASEMFHDKSGHTASQSMGILRVNSETQGGVRWPLNQGTSQATYALSYALRGQD